MDSLLIQLNEQANSTDLQCIKSKLKTLIAQVSQIEMGNVDTFQTLLASTDKDVLILTAQCIAEFAKNDTDREQLTKKEIIQPLLQHCSSIGVLKTVHFFRAIGNLTYENHSARDLVQTDGVHVILDTINSALTAERNFNLLTVASGCLLNVIMSNDDLQKAAFKHDVLTTTEQILEIMYNDFENQETCITYSLQILDLISDHMLDQWLTENLCRLLVGILKVSQNIEISVLCLEILRVQSENDDIKLILAREGTCELVYELVEKYGNQADDEESRSILKMACDLVVLILTGDESMQILYDKSNGKVYKQMMSWIDSQDADLLSTGVLAIGNFARNDSHCIYMVNSGLSKKLLNILAKYNTMDADVKLQHALLSALRHLSIPSENKPKLLEENIIEILYSMINVDHSSVVFKLMGTFRMLVDGQEKTALDLINRKEFIEKIVDWCYNSDHLGVHAEAPRLLVWLIKNCHSFKPFPMILSVKDSVKCLVDMIASMHTVMQNEAILALNLMCSYCFCNRHKENDVTNMNLDEQSNYVGRTNFDQLLIDADIGKNVIFLINKYHEKMEYEKISNLLVLLEQLRKSVVVLEHLQNCNLDQSLVLLSKNKNASELRDKINELISIFKSC